MAQDERRDLSHVPSRTAFVSWAGSSSPEIWQLLPQLQFPCTSLSFLLTEPWAYFHVYLCHLVVTSRVDLQFHNPWSRWNCRPQYILNRPALNNLQNAILLFKVLPNSNSSERYQSTAPLLQGQIQSPQNTPQSTQLHSLPTNTGAEIRPVLTGQSSFTRVCRGEQNLPAGPAFTRASSPKAMGRDQCQTKARSIINLPIAEGYNDFHISFVFITKLFSPEKLPNRHIIHACSSLLVGLSRSVRATNAPDPIGLGPCRDFREGMLSFPRPLAARLPQYKPTEYQSQVIHCWINYVVNRLT